MDKILGVDKTPKKSGQAETKPFTNFGVFHDNLITRLKALSQIQLDFEKRAKEAENRFADKLVEMRKQLDNRWKQIDKFEASVKVAAESKSTWRRKMASKDGEIEALKATTLKWRLIYPVGRSLVWQILWSYAQPSPALRMRSVAKTTRRTNWRSRGAIPLFPAEICRGGHEVGCARQGIRDASQGRGREVQAGKARRQGPPDRDGANHFALESPGRGDPQAKSACGRYRRGEQGSQQLAWEM
ncbi:hypothetical protein BD626DRAFT_516705, partial [Schizophyllum amplum]